MNEWDLPNLDSTCQICKQDFTDISGKGEICMICHDTFMDLLKFSGLI